MATLQELAQALQNAKSAGNVEDAAILQAALNKEMGVPEAPSYETKPDYSALGNLTRGIGAGIVGTAETAALGLASLLDEEAELNARKKIQAAAERITPEGDPDSGLFKFGTGLGSFATFAVPGGAAARLARTRGATLKGQQAAALGTAGTLGVGAGAGEASERARAAGATEGERRLSTLGGAAVGLTEVLPLGKIFPKQFELPIMRGLNAKMGPQGVQRFRDRVYRAGIAGGYEGAQEATAAILQNLIEKGIYNPQRELLDLGVAEEALIGGEVGAFVQFFTDLFYRRAPKKPKVDAPPTDETVDIKQIQGVAPSGVIDPATGEIIEGEVVEEVKQEIDPDDKKIKEAAEEVAKDDTVSQVQYQEVVESVKAGDTRPTISAVMRRFKLDYATAAAYMDSMESEGVVSPIDAKGSRSVLQTPDSAADVTGPVPLPARDPKEEERYQKALIFIQNRKRVTPETFKQLADTLGISSSPAGPVRSIFNRMENEGIITPEELPPRSKKRPDLNYRVNTDVALDLKETRQKVEKASTKPTLTPDNLIRSGFRGVRVPELEGLDFQEVFEVQTKTNRFGTGLFYRKFSADEVGDYGYQESADGRLAYPRGAYVAYTLNDDGGVDTIVHLAGQEKNLLSELPSALENAMYLGDVDIEPILEEQIKRREAEDAGFRAGVGTDTGELGEAGDRTGLDDSEQVDTGRKKRKTTKRTKTSLRDAVEGTRDTARGTGAGERGEYNPVDPNDLDDVPNDFNLQRNEPELIDPISNQAMQAAGRNQLSVVLNDIIDNSKNPVIKSIARKLAEYSDGVSIRVSNAKDPDAQSVVERLTEQYGRFDGGVFLPASDASRKLGMANTIIIIPKPDGTINTQTVLHEMTHAATHKILANKSHPVTKQLTKLFETVKDYSPSIFGATDVDEFVAEAFSNVNFKDFLANVQIKTQGNKYINALESFFNSIANFVRAMAGAQPKTIIRVNPESDLLGMNISNKTDNLISQILAPPGTSDAEPLFSRNRPETKTKLLDAIVEATKTKITKAESNEAVSKFMAVLSDKKTKLADAFEYYVRNGAAPMHFMVELTQNEKFSYVDAEGVKQYRIRDAVERLRQAFENQRGLTGKLIENTEAMNVKLKEYTDKMGDKKLAAVDRLMSRESATNVNAEMRLDYYGKDEFIDEESNITKNEMLRKLKQEYSLLDNTQKAYRKEILGNYKTLISRLRAHVEKTIDVVDKKTGETKQQARSKLKKLIDEKLFPAGKIEPYVPFFREGDYEITYQVTDAYADEIFGNTYVERFTSRHAMEQAIVELQNGDPKIIKKDQDGNLVGFAQTKDDGSFNWKGANITTGVVGELVKTLNDAGVETDQANEIIGSFVELLPGSTFARVLQKRKGTPGFLGQDTPLGRRENFSYVAGRKIPEFGRKIIQLEMATEFNEITSELETARKQYRTFTDDSRMADSVDLLVKDMSERMNFGKNAQRGPLSNFLRRTAFFYTIGFNVSSSIINLSHMPLIVYPWLSAKYGYGKTGRAVTDAGKIMNAGKVIGDKRKRQTLAGTEVDIDSPKMLGVQYDFVEGIDTYFVGEINKETGKTTYVLRKDLKFPNKETENLVRQLQPLVQKMKDRDLFVSSYLAAELDVNEMGRKKTLTDELTGMSAYWFNYMDTRTRQITAISSFLLDTGLNEPGAKKLSAEALDKAAEDAVYTTQKLNGGTTAETGARLAQGDYGSVALMYKNYGLTVYGNLFEAAKRYYDFRFGSKVDQNTGKKESDIAFKQLVGIHGSALLLAGAQAMPLYALYRIIANLFLDDDDEDADVLARKYLTELGYKGPIVALTGIDYASRASLSELLFQFNRFNPDANLEETLWFYFGGPAGGVAKTFERGVKDLANGNTERGVEAFMPTAARNMYRSIFRYSREGALTRRGDPVYTDWSIGDLAFQAFGFAPSEYTKANEQKMSLKNIDNAITRKRSTLLKKYYVAIRVGDWEKSQKIMADIMEFNEKYGLTKAAITSDTIKRSMKRQAAASLDMWHGVLISPMNRDALRLKRDEWDIGLSLFPDE